MSRCTYIWEFDVPAESRNEFERRYGPDGAWAELFRRSPDYIETLLLKDTSRAGRYVTVDFWRSDDAYRAFRVAHSESYDRLDRACESLTVRETFLGGFVACVA